MSEVIEVDAGTQRVSPVAILVDGENFRVDFAENIWREANVYGCPTVRRVYGRAEHISSWDNEGYRLVPTRPGKNSADLLLCVEAMALALREQFHTLIIASSDRDFTYLAETLRELGHCVVGVGEAKAPVAFRKACSTFIEFLPQSPNIGIVAAPIKAPEQSVNREQQLPPSKPKQKPKLSPLEEGVIAELKAGNNSTGVLLTSLNVSLRRNLDVKISDTPDKCWRTFFTQRNDLFDCDPRGPNAKVRLKICAKPVPHTLP